ncbi:MAG: UDP-N-acetylglucosamine 1-carboxyvinyltransferase [Eubacteriales bacterium]|nr:UDP-N-acetylglucosamine 1-carboxyvinyltransferase [Desulforudis sp.]MDP3051296.1 UDP-N-acetylglucosamine 1-carboxyvinyltransferase [Eubacteriales bacterium]MDZ4043896.1 UDP-N-acetylglucosamine 1-carboxyvinyltransferase [Eubacteriales bacterium]MDZ7609966.1 UDP-N-acetylglucosamine 1-carboxyvinyltransferase [Eubacteriales bacterium]
MERIVVRGGKPLQGRIKVCGAKNATLAILSAVIMTDGEVILDNVPDISDVRVMVEIIEALGAQSTWLAEDTLSIKCSPKMGYEAPYQLVKKLRASNLLLGPLLARFGAARVALPGGCNIGSRPMDLHFKGLIGLGAELRMDRGYVSGRAGRLQGSKIYLDFPSVGATENIMMAAALAEGQTVVENVAKEPEVVDLANFLNAMGAKIRGAGTDVIKIEGVRRFRDQVRYSIIPDRIEAGTFMVAAAATGGDIVVENVIPPHFEPLNAKLREANVLVEERDDSIRVSATEPLYPINIKTMPYPGFATDMQSQLMSLLSMVPGTSVIVENIFENRFQVAQELRRMGARIKVEGRVAIIEGVARLQGTQVRATDLRAGAALIIAGLIAEGRTEIQNVHFIDRGYWNLENRIRSLGADIRRE